MHTIRQTDDVIYGFLPLMLNICDVILLFSTSLETVFPSLAIIVMKKLAIACFYTVSGAHDRRKERRERSVTCLHSHTSGDAILVLSGQMNIELW